MVGCDRHTGDGRPLPGEINISRYRLLSVDLKCLCIYGKFKDVHIARTEMCV